MSQALRSIIPDDPYLSVCTQAGLSGEEANACIMQHLQGLTPPKRPRIIHTLGIPAAGKTTWARDVYSMMDNTLMLNFDSVMESLPVYQKDRAGVDKEAAFKKWELCARAIGYEIFFQAAESGLNILFDHSGTRPEHVDLLKEMKEELGYHVTVVNFYVDQDIARERIKHRERFCPPEYIPQRAQILSRLLPHYQMIADQFDSIDTGGPALSADGSQSAATSVF